MQKMKYLQLQNHVHGKEYMPGAIAGFQMKRVIYMGSPLKGTKLYRTVFKIIDSSIQYT